jgi:membrane-bound serine protease (ClpP class)
VLLLIALLLTLFVLPAPWGVIVVLVALGIEVLEIIFWRRFLRRYRISAGPETLIGMLAEVVEPCQPDGRVRLRGELWKARASRPAKIGARVRVTEVVGLTVHVTPEES